MTLRLKKQITLFVSIIMLFTFIPFQNIFVYAYPDTEVEFKQYLENENISYYSYQDKYKANFSVFQTYGLVVYGSPHGDTEYSRETGRNERRFLGYTYNNQPYTNQLFPNDATSGRNPEKWNFIKVDDARRSWDISADLKNYILTTKLEGHGASTLTVNSIGGMEYAKIQSLPTLKNEGSVFVQHKTSNGKVWYATFIVPPLGGSTDVTGTVSTPSNTYTIESNQDSITVPVTVTANAQLVGAYVKPYHIANIKATYQDQSKSASTTTTVNVIKNITLKRSDYGDGTHTVVLEGKAEMESIYQDRYIAKPKKNITLVVKSKGANSITTTATANPSEVKFNNADINVQVNVQSILNGYSNLSNISHWKFYAKKTQDSTEQEVTVNASVLSAIGAFNFTIPKLAITGDNYTQVFNTRGKVFFKDGTSMEAPASTSTYVYKILGNNPIAIIDAPDEVRAGDSFGISGAKSYDTDGTIVNYSWSYSAIESQLSPDKKTGTLTMSQGTQTLGLTVTDNDGLTGSTSKKINVLPPTPTAVIKIIGTPKENRKIILDANSSYTPEKFPINWSKTTWSITPVSGGTATDIKYSGTLTGTATKDILIKKSGIYKISLTVTNSAGYSNTTEMTQFIEVDEKPVVDFTAITTLYRDPDNMNKAIMEVVATGYSPDGDILKYTKAEYAYDSNNNGSFTDETKTALDHNKLNLDGNLQIEVQEVGKYKVWLYGEEEFGQPTISSFITFADIRKADTLSKPDNQAVIEVANLAPTVDFAIQGKRKVDLFLNKATDINMTLLQSKINSIIIPVLESENIDANIVYNDGGSAVYGDISASNLSVTFRKPNGEIWGAGHGQNLGFGYNYQWSTYPTVWKSPAIDNIQMISKGISNHRFYIKKESNGTLKSYGVGDGWEYQLGTGGSSLSNVTSPFPAPSTLDANNIEFISTSLYTSYAKMKDGKVYGWGWQRFSQITDVPYYNNRVTTPAIVPNLPNKNLIDIQASAETTYFLYEDGTVYRAGHNILYGVDLPVIQITKISNAIAVAPLNLWVGGSRALILKKDGTVWLYNYDRTTGEIETRDSFVQIAGLSNIVQISSGGERLALRNDGKVFSQIDSTPVEILGLKDIIKIETGYGSSYAMDKDGYIYSWGNNQYGQLGTGNYNNLTSPYKIPNFTLKESNLVPLKDVISKPTWRNDAEHFFINLNDNILPELNNDTDSSQILLNFMENDVNYIGLGKSANKTQIEEFIKKNDSKGKYIDNTNIDVALESLANHIAYRILVDLNINVGITAQGDFNAIQSKINAIVKPKLEAQNIDADIKLKDGSVAKYGTVKSSSLTSHILLPNGYLMGAGLRNYRLGSGYTTGGSYATTFEDTGLDNSTVQKVKLSYLPQEDASHIIALDENKNPRAWGSNANASFGRGNTSGNFSRLIPEGLNGLDGKQIKKIVLGATNNTAVLMNDGKVYVNGSNYLGYLSPSLSSMTNILVPTLLPEAEGKNIKDIALGRDSDYPRIALVTEEGEMYATNLGTRDFIKKTDINNVKKVEFPSSNQSMTQVFVLKEDGTVWTFYNNATPSKVVGFSDIVDIITGYNFLIALDKNGEVWTHGQNDYGQIGNGTTTYRNTAYKVTLPKKIVQISAGAYSWHAIDEDGNLWACGYNDYGNLGDGTNQHKYTPVKINGVNLLQKNNMSLVDVINDTIYRPTANHYFVNLNDSINPELNTANTNGIADNLKLDEVRYITLGTNSNLSQVEQFLSANGIQGSFINNANIDTALDQLADYIIETAMRNRRTDKYVLLDEELEYITYYADKENDPKHDEKWKFVHDPNHFENSLGLHAQSNVELKQPIRAFNKVGKYEAIYQAQDNPKNKAEFNPYWLWSDKNLTDYYIYVHRPPIADFDIYPVINTATGKYVFYTLEKSYDLDHQSKANKGIVRKVWKWKELNETEWHKGIIPNEQDSSKMYLIQLDVQDEEGVWVSTTKLVDRAVEMPLDFTATLTPSYPTGIPASENVTIDVDVFSPIDVTSVQAQLEGETTIVTLTKTGQNGDNTHKYYRGTYTIPKTKGDNKGPVIDFYKMVITVKNVLNKVISKDYKVKVATPINLVPNMLSTVEPGQTITITATTSKYVDQALYPVTVTIFGTTYPMAYDGMAGTLKKWKKDITIPNNQADGNYTATFKARTPQNQVPINEEVKTVNFVINSFQIVSATLMPNPALAGDELIFTIETKGGADRIEIVVPNDIVIKDDRAGKYSYPLKFNVNGAVDHKTDVFRYISSVKMDKTLTPENVRLRSRYIFTVRVWKGTTSKEQQLDLDVRRSVLDLVKPGIKDIQK